jgi:hypothetical protein
MKVDLEALQRFVGGQFELQNVTRGYYCVGEIERIEIDENGSLVIWMHWVARKAKGKWWITNAPGSCAMDPESYDAVAAEDGRLLCNGVNGPRNFWPTAFVDKSKIPGLELVT